MSLAARLLVAVVVTALFSVGLTGYLSHRSASERVPRAFGMVQAQRGGGAGATADLESRAMGQASGAMGASRALLAELRRSTVQAAAIALGAAVLGGGWIALRASVPITRLADVTRRYGAGERGLRASPRGPAEVIALARVFNDTANRLQAEEDQRRRFMADVAHELRTPLTVLKSELEAIQDGLMQADPETLHQLVQQVDLLGRLVADLRTLTLAEAGELALDHGPIDLAGVARDAAGSFAARARLAGARLELDLAPAVAVGDADRLRQVVNALLDNALRHSTAGTCVCVRVFPGADGAVLEVLDDGPGIAPEARPYLFQRFFCGDPARRRATGGSGLGLAIVAAIVDLHGGRVEVLERDGGGTRLRVTLPGDRVLASAAEARSSLRPAGPTGA
jgi:two-component system, OmpR family, sensor histidine kinase BaeS